MKRTEKELSEYQVRIAKLKRMFDWHLKEADKIHKKAAKQKEKGYGKAGFLNAIGDHHTIEAERLKALIKETEHSFNNPTMLMRFKRFFFGI